MNEPHDMSIALPVGKRILVVDDDRGTCQVIQNALRGGGYDVTVANSGVEAIKLAEDSAPDLVLLDLIMPGGIDGFETASRIRALPLLRHLPIIFVSSVRDPINLERIFSLGNGDYVSKPVNPDEMLARIAQQLTMRRQAGELFDLQQETSLLTRGILSRDLEHEAVFQHIITGSLAMRSIFQYIEAVAVTSRPVLITGETGTGKEVIANCVHEVSGRPGKLVAVNVAGLDDNLFTDALFGHVKGAYTGAEKARAGLIEQAAGGTLFLDEIGDLGPVSQVKLLRLLQEREYYPLGSDARKYSDARIIVATHSPLQSMIENGRFRSDLFYRLRTHTIKIPPLRERRRDVPLLFKYFLKRTTQQLGVPIPTPTQDLLEHLMRYDYPGNVRELESMVFDAVSRNRSRRLGVESFSIFSNGLLPALSDSAELRTTAADWGWPGVEMDFEGQFPTLKAMTDLLVDKALERTNGNQATAASLLGLTRQALNKRLKRRKEEEEEAAAAGGQSAPASVSADEDESEDA